MKATPDAMRAASGACLDMGVTILQGFRLAATDQEHVAALLAFMRPEIGSWWADVGCGFGAVAREMQSQRPDLRFVLVNDDEWQLEQADRGTLQVLCDFHAMALPNATVDGCMFLYSLCHADDLGLVLSEAARVTRRGGRLVVYDYERVRGENDLMERFLCARAWSGKTLRVAARDAGWVIDEWRWPAGSDAVFRSVCCTTPQETALYDAVMSELRPVLWSAVQQ